jgi:hypothetical protein
MAAINSTEDWDRVRRVRDLVAQQLLEHPLVSLVDIGLNPEKSDDPYALVVRVHLKNLPGVPPPEIPAMIQDVPVRLINADYKLE